MNPTRTKTPEQSERRADYLRAKIAKAQQELDLLPPASSSLTPKAGEPEALNILIGCPAFGGACQHVFVSSLIALSQTLVNSGINHQIKFLGNQSLIPLARDHFANALFDGDTQGRPFTHLLFLDVDQGFGVADVLTMLRANKEIIALPSSPKSIQWEQVALAARRGVPAEQLQHFTARPNFEELTRRIVLDERACTGGPHRYSTVLDTTVRF